jgi:alkylhydroperoxidase/carboxymuconolactone decarboxylase family protein YurZ
MASMAPRPPTTYNEFVSRFPSLGKSWELMHEAGEAAGPLTDRERQLIKLGISIGALREGAVHSAVRKARAAGIKREEIEQVAAISATTIGLPSAVAAWTWVREVAPHKPKRKAGGKKR